MKRHRGDDVVSFLGASNRHVETTLATLLVDWAKETAELALRITPECRRENHHVALISLHRLQVLHKEADILLMFNPVALGNVSDLKLRILGRFVHQHVFNQITLHFIERDDTDRRRLSASQPNLPEQT